MSSFKPTDSQKTAIENTGGPLLVSAAAGSGKTKVLTSRLIKYLTDPEKPRDITNFLIITYTNAAAAELRSKISEDLAKNASFDNKNTAHRKQFALIPNAHIETIHRFCARLLRDNAHLLGISPEFKIAEQEAAGVILEASLNAVLHRAYSRGDEDFLALVDSIGYGKDDLGVAKILANVYSAAEAHARPEEWILMQIENLGRHYEDAGETAWGQVLLQDVRNAADYWDKELSEILSEMCSCPHREALFKLIDNISETQSQIHDLNRAAGIGWDAVNKALPITFPRFPIIKNPDCAFIVENVKTKRNLCKKNLALLAPIFAVSSASILHDTKQTAPVLISLLNLVLDLKAEYTARKKRLSVLDFSDLEHLAVSILLDENGQKTLLAKKVSLGFDEVMVDEYQDISPVQEEIVKAVSKDEDNLFVVGDVKQSIYGFRLADPTIFTGRYKSSRSAEEAAPGERRRVLLSENFRSRPEILDFANAVFGRIMSEPVGGIDYGPDVQLKPGLSFSTPGHIPEIVAVVPNLEEDDEDNSNIDGDVSGIRAEAAFVAERIFALVNGNEKIFDGDLRRQVEYGDIAILLRSIKSSIAPFQAELFKLGIPVSTSEPGGDFFYKKEIKYTIALLKIIDNPHQDVPLIAALMSPLFGFSADDISKIRTYDRHSDLFTATKLAARQDIKCKEFIDTLYKLRQLSGDTELSLLISYIYNETNSLAIAAADGGDTACARLARLLELAHSFESSGFGSLHRFIDTLDSMAEEGKAPVMPDSGAGGAVHITTVHKSKGLQYPVVFYCDVGRGFNMQDTKGSVLLHKDMGVGADLIDPLRGIKYPTLAKMGIAKKLREEALSEEMRIMYVAVTRAMERLYISFSAGKKFAELYPDIAPDISLGSKIDPYITGSKKSVAEWLICVFGCYGGMPSPFRFYLSADYPKSSAALKSSSKSHKSPDLQEETPLSCVNLSFSYDYEDDIYIPSKLSVTEIKNAARDEADPEAWSLGQSDFSSEFLRPVFEKRKAGAAEVGTAAHTVMQHINYNMTGSADEIRLEIERLYSENRLSDDEAKTVSAESIYTFFNSDLGKRAKSASRVYREFPFTLLIPVSEVYADYKGNEKSLIQGKIDLFFEEEDEIVLVDYKTGKVSASYLKEAAEKHKVQLLLYAKSLERITGKLVKSAYIYYLYSNLAYDILNE